MRIANRGPFLNVYMPEFGDVLCPCLLRGARHSCNLTLGQHMLARNEGMDPCGSTYITHENALLPCSFPFLHSHPKPQTLNPKP